MNKLKYLFFYLQMILGNKKLDWENSNFKYNKSKTGFYSYYGLGLLEFKKLDNTSNYSTTVSYIGDLFIDLKLETSKDLDNFCNRKFVTLNEGTFIKTPTKYQFLKNFYNEK